MNLVPTICLPQILKKNLKSREDCLQKCELKIIVNHGYRGRDVSARMGPLDRNDTTASQNSPVTLFVFSNI